MRVCFLAYRDWALRSIEEVTSLCDVKVVDLIRSEEEYRKIVLSYPDGYVDCIVLVGWSWIIRDDTLQRFLCVGVHPSDLPQYRGGSPIQHQIIAGLEKTRISLMNISPDGVDVGDIWLKEEWKLTGQTMKDILDDLSISTVRLLQRFFQDFYSLAPKKQDLSKGTYYKRRSPEESRVTWERLAEMKLKDAYNLIRALEDPYPNLFVEDEKGNKLYFKEVEYKEHE